MAIYTLSKNKSEKWHRIRNLTLSLLVILVSTLAGLIGSVLWPSSHKSSAVVISADKSRIVKLNQVSNLVKFEAESIGSGLHELANVASITSEQAITEFISTFSSTDIQKNFFLERELFRLEGYSEPTDSLAFRHLIVEFSAQFGYNITNTIGENPMVTLFFSYQSPEGSAELLNAFIDHVAGITATNLYNQQQDNLTQLQQTLTSVTDHYSAIQQNLQQDILAQEQESSSLTDYYWQQQARLAASIHAKRLQAWYLSQAIAKLSSEPGDFKPVRIISIANAENSLATPDKVFIIFIILAIGILLAIASVLLFRVKEPESN